MKMLVPERFNVIRILREDVYSKTFLANDDVLQRTDVVVKLIRKGHFSVNSDPAIEKISWFTGIRHDSLGTIFDGGITTKGDLCLVREHWPISDLFTADNLTVIKALISAVSFLQSKGQVHGAIKPSNLFINGGRLKLVDPDFKGAEYVQSEESIRYTAPEVLRGEAPSLESDVYSVGAVLYRVLTQRNLFEDANLNHLRAKYVWASPMPIGNISGVPKIVTDLVMSLLNREPHRRMIAFGSLREQIGGEPEPALRAPFVGQRALIKETLATISQSSNRRLRVLLVNGVPGIGKSRFIEELGIRCGLAGFLFWKCACALADEFGCVSDGIVNLLKRIKASELSGSSDLSQHDGADGESQRIYRREKMITEVISSLVHIARNRRLALAIENVQHADPATMRFIEQLSFRAAELPITVILTKRSARPEPKILPILQGMPDAVQQIRIPALTATECSELIGYFDTSAKQHRDLEQLTGGNPLFIEECTRRESGRERRDEALTWMLTQIPKKSRPLTVVLSVIKKPIDLGTLAKIIGEDPADIERQLADLEEIGIIERQGNTFQITSSALNELMHRRLYPSKRSKLARRTFEVLSERQSSIEDLAYYASEAGLFKESSKLYQQLSNQAYELKNYKEAASYYIRIEECERLGGVPLTPNQRMKLAYCFQLTGKPSKGLLILRKLLTTDTVLSDPELLAAAYRQLALSFDKTPHRERVRLIQLAIQCLPSNSPQIARTNIELANNLIRMGELSAATDALQTASQYLSTDEDANSWKLERSILAATMGDFKGARDFLLSITGEAARSGAVLNDLAVCFENLGDLRRALELQSKAYDFTVANGMAARRVLTMANLGSMKTKLGQMREARRLFEEAITAVAQMQRKERLLDRGKFVGVYYDSALYHIQTGSYRAADECLRQVQNTVSLYAPGQLFYETVKCHFYLSIGFFNRARSLLAELNKTQASNTSFFEVERSLLEARMPNISPDEKLSLLQRALENTYQLGTLYQQAQVLNELAAILISVSKKTKALEYTNSALRLSQKQGYRLLRTRALLLGGLASEKHRGKEQKLLAAFQNASEIGLQELIAESAFHLGLLHLESGNLVTAREYLSRSVSTTESLTSEVPTRFRGAYRAKQWHRDARKQLERCGVAIEQQSMNEVPSNIEVLGGDRYFKAAYNFALSGAATKSAEVLVNQIEQTLQTSVERTAVIILKDLKGPIVRGVRIKISDELVGRASAAATIAKNRIYFGAPDVSRPKETVVWIPLQSDTRDGGIYLVCRQNEPALTEKEMEFLAIIGTIGNGALRALEANQAVDVENARLAEFHGMVGASKAIREVYSHIEIASKNLATVLIEGESGTGKELVAKAIHAAGPRTKEPFIAVDCGAIPESLIEAELFGAKRGSYTGALTDRAGLFEAAHRGTIFLDEISNTTPALQGKLLRVIQEREIRRLGETKDRAIDVRVIVATNRNLEELVADGRFRKDLLYRLKVLYIKVPPLRNRREDIPMIAHAFLQKLNATNNLKKYCAPGVIDHLSAQNFPGNVRELQNAIERAFFLSKGNVINDIPVEDQILTNQDQVQSWFKDLIEGRRDFWKTVHDGYKRRDITRDKVLALVDLGLRSSGGSYASLASKFHLKRNEYRRFMDFLRRSRCLLDFRPYRKAAAADMDADG
jgi:transcriptional regulator with GAF, ATPase, and Fis domain/serine/threonine protein kinase/tetratricopeptide (TPR) repeat protein